jgi:hypothetical protein
MSENILRMESKISRKLVYLKRLAEYFNSDELLSIVSQIKSEIADLPHSSEAEMRLFTLKCKNNKLRFVKKKYENLFYNEFSNVAAFHLKSELKDVEPLGLYNELFQKISENEINDALNKSKGTGSV